MWTIVPSGKLLKNKSHLGLFQYGQGITDQYFCFCFTEGTPQCSNYNKSKRVWCAVWKLKVIYSCVFLDVMLFPPWKSCCLLNQKVFGVMCSRFYCLWKNMNAPNSLSFLMVFGRPCYFEVWWDESPVAETFVPGWWPDHCSYTPT